MEKPKAPGKPYYKGNKKPGAQQPQGAQHHQQGGQHHPQGAQHHPQGGQHHPQGGQHHPPGGQHHPQGGQHHPPGGQHYPPGGQHCPPGGQHYPPGGQHCPPGGQHHPPGGQHHPQAKQHQPQTGHHQPQTGHHQPQTGHHQPQTGHHQPQTGHHQPQTNQNRQQNKMRVVKQHPHVRIPLGSLRLCTQFGMGVRGNCSHNPCAIHICRDYLAGTCPRGPKCTMPHSIIGALRLLPPMVMDASNLSILKHIHCEVHMREVVSKSFPRICLHYNKSSCNNGDKCKYLHICKCVISFHDNKEIVCTHGLLHNLSTSTAQDVLRKYQLDVELPMILANILAPYTPSAQSACLCKMREGYNPENRRRPGTKKHQRPAGHSGRNSPSSILANDGSVYDDSSDSDNESASVVSGHSDLDKYLDDADLYNSPEEKIINTNNLSMKDPAITEKEQARIQSSVSKIQFYEQARNIIHDAGGRMPFSIFNSVATNKNIFPRGYNVSAGFDSNSGRFFIKKNTGGAIIHVGTIETFRLCAGYNGTGCADRNCSYFHVCRDYITGVHKPECPLAHSFTSEGSRFLLSKLDINIADAGKLLLVMRNSVPRICVAYNTGHCRYGDECHFLHICEAKFLEGTCKQGNTDAHNHNIISQQCSAILKSYGLIGLKNEILKHIVLPYKRQANEITSQNISASSNVGGFRGSKLNIASGSSDAGSSRGSQVDLSSVGLSRANNDNQTKRNKSSAKKVDDDSEEKQAFRRTVRAYLHNEGGRVGCDKFLKDMTPNFPTYGDLLATVEKAGNFLVRKNAAGSITEIGVVEDVRLCSKYNDDECVDEKCSYFHLCEEYIAGNCGRDCKLNHNVRDSKTKFLLQKKDIHVTEPRKIVFILCNSLPQICSMYNSEQECLFGEDCRNLHICEDFLLGEGCKKGVSCRNHDIQTKTCKRVLAEYRMSTWHLTNLRLVVLPSRKTAKKGTNIPVSSNAPPISAVAVKEEITQKNVFEDVNLLQRSDSAESNQSGAKPKCKLPKDDADKTTSRAQETKAEKTSGTSLSPDSSAVDDLFICEVALRGGCPSQNTCRMLHRPLPYCWQYESKSSWHDFSDTDNAELEVAFCTVAKDSWLKEDITLLEAQRNKYPFYKDIRAWFTSMSMLSTSIPSAESSGEARMKMPIRRLGTASYIDARPIERFTTSWRWYYYDDEKVWSQPEIEMQHMCEQEFLLYKAGQREAVLTMTAAENQEFCVDFDDMKIYPKGGLHAEMNVRRRPLLVSVEDVKKGLNVRLPASSVQSEKSPEVVRLEQMNAFLTAELLKGNVRSTPEPASPTSPPTRNTSVTMLPEQWRAQVTDLEIVHLSPLSAEWDNVESRLKSALFLSGASNSCRVTDVQRVQWKSKWEKFTSVYGSDTSLMYYWGPLDLTSTSLESSTNIQLHSANYIPSDALTYRLSLLRSATNATCVFAVRSCTFGSPAHSSATRQQSQLSYKFSQIYPEYKIFLQFVSVDQFKPRSAKTTKECVVQ